MMDNNVHHQRRVSVCCEFTLWGLFDFVALRGCPMQPLRAKTQTAGSHLPEDPNKIFTN
jgi:hypothetical protein